MDIPEPDQGISSTRLLDFIAAAFPLRPLPQMSLHQAQLADQSMSREITDEEWRRAGELDRGRSWNEFSDDDLIACDAALSHLDEQSFVYYLPAYLLFALRYCTVEWQHPAWTLIGSVVFSVTHRTPDQREAVIAFLRFVAKCRTDSIASNAQKALARYWLTDEATKPLIILPNG
jgi:hypothetical protein